jgi:hypothetical protein
MSEYPRFIEGDPETGDLIVEMDEDHRYILQNMEGSCYRCHHYGRLFAAAPDLLEFARAVLREHKPSGGELWHAGQEVCECNRCNQARAAIAHATGDNDVR